MICLGFVFFWYAAGTAWWWRAMGRLLCGDLPYDALLIPVSWVIYASFGLLPWLIVRPEDYRGP